MKFKYLLIRQVYKLFIKRFLFLFPPEFVHDSITFKARLIAKLPVAKFLLSRLLSYHNPSLQTTVKGRTFINPIGLSAGFDKDAKLVGILPYLGFGHAEIGSVTLNPYKGNDKPRLYRLKKSKSIWVNYGLKNDGTQKVLERFERNRQKDVNYGISVAKTNSKDNCDDNTAIQDYVESVQMITKSSASYITINISCPNTFGGEPFTTPDRIGSLLSAIDKVQTDKLVFIKMPISIDNDVFVSLLEEIVTHKVDGVIVGNLQKDKTGPLIKDKLNETILQKGGLSGLPTQKRSTELIKLAYKNFGQRLIVVGCGGIFNADDAYEKIRAGATLLQMITGLIFEGPGIVGEINYGLVKLLERDGFEKIEDVVGIDAKIA